MKLDEKYIWVEAPTMVNGIISPEIAHVSRETFEYSGLKRKKALAFLSKQMITNADITGVWLLNDSVQYRPKVIYQNSKGYYIKEKSKRVYLDTYEVEEAISLNP